MWSSWRFVCLLQVVKPPFCLFVSLWVTPANTLIAITKNLSTHLLITLWELISTLFVECHDDTDGVFSTHNWSRDHAFGGIFGLFIHKVTEMRVLKIIRRTVKGLVLKEPMHYIYTQYLHSSSDSQYWDNNLESKHSQSPEIASLEFNKTILQGCFLGCLISLVWSYFLLYLTSLFLNSWLTSSTSSPS